MRYLSLFLSFYSSSNAVPPRCHFSALQRQNSLEQARTVILLLLVSFLYDASIAAIM